jgi:hypothetical protein
MSRQTGFASSGKGQLNTLAQTATPQQAITAPYAVVYGKGTDLSNGEALYNRAKKKAITQRVIKALVDVAKEKGEREWVKRYWNTWHCQNRVQTANGKLFGKYCKNRICTVCCGIRKAEIIHKYYDTVSQWESPHLVTITVKSVSAGLLKSRMKEMLKAFQKIVKKYSKWYSRGKSIKLIGIKSLECNFNPFTKKYNPHFHIIVPNRATGNLIIQEWRKYWGGKLANSDAQNNKEISNIEGALREVIKYSSKIFTKPTSEEEKKQNIPPTIYVSALHNILVAMKGLRIFDRFGFDLPKDTDKKQRKASIVFEVEDWDFDPTQMDWVNARSSKNLAGFTIGIELKEILSQRINMALE